MTSYTYAAPHAVSKLFVRPWLASSDAVVKVQGAEATSGEWGATGILLGDGDTEVTVAVVTMAQTKTYRVSVTRAAATSSDASLCKLSAAFRGTQERTPSFPLRQLVTYRAGR